MNFNIRVADTLAGIEECVDDLMAFPADSATHSIAVDLEGVNLSRKGRVSLVQMKANHSTLIWLLDVTVLGQAAFTHPNNAGLSVKDILESSEIKKLFYDVRRDSDALYNHYGVDMKNVVDIQLIELAVRRSNGLFSRYLNGLAKTISAYLSTTPEWTETKNLGRSLFAPNLGGSAEAFEIRPLNPILLGYSAQDVELLGQLETTLWGRIRRTVPGRKKKPTWEKRVQDGSARRLLEAKSPHFDEDGPHRALSPVL